MWAIATYQKGYNPITPLTRVIPQLPFYRGPITPFGGPLCRDSGYFIPSNIPLVGRCSGRMKPCGEGTDASMEVNEYSVGPFDPTQHWHVADEVPEK